MPSDDDSDRRVRGYHPSEAPTEKAAKGGILVKIGQHKATVPVGTILTSIGAGILAAAGWIKSYHADLIAADLAQTRAIESVAAKQATNDVILSEIRTQLARIDARVAEVQVVLMQARRP